MTATTPLTADDIRKLGDELFDAMRGRYTLAPLTERYPGITIDDAYGISLRMLDRRLQEGERIVGKKIGVTGKRVQQMLNVHQPDFGFLTDKMLYTDGAEMPVSKLLIQPRAEGEIAFELASRLKGPGLTDEDVLRATRYIRPCFEIVDSRIHDWKIRIQDTVADNASCGLLTLGAGQASPQGIDFHAIRLNVTKNGQPLSSGTGEEAMGSPLKCVTWLANTLGERGIVLEPGDVILSGSLVPLEPVKAGDVMELELEGVGKASVRFT